MATIAEQVPAIVDAVSVRDPSVTAEFRTFLARAGRFLRQLAPPTADVADGADLTFFARIRKFLWLSSGLFSAGSFSISAIGYLAFGSADNASTNFIAAIVSACSFGFASLLHFGPDVA